MTDIDYTPESIEIQLTHNHVTVVDEIDKGLASFTWHSYKGRNTFYARRTTWDGKHKHTIQIHRVILSQILGRELSRHELVDHVDGNGLNNRRSNLRLSTSVENTRNQKRRSDNSVGFKGVSFRKDELKWVARIQVNGKSLFLGYFNSPELAHEAYCQAAREHYGEFARFE